MTDNRPLCARCQFSMTREKNGVKVKYSTTEAQMGDLFECPGCGAQIITGFGMKFTDQRLGRYDYVRNTHHGLSTSAKGGENE